MLELNVPILIYLKRRQGIDLTLGFHQRTNATCMNYHNVMLCWVGITYILINTDGYPQRIFFLFFNNIVKP